MSELILVRRIRIWLAIFIFGLVVSGITAFPLESELRRAGLLIGYGWVRCIG